ncbi:hypothetical protein GCM10028807_09790 [Spirosoma daeguense]
MKQTPRLKPHQPDSVPQVSWLRAEGNYTHLYFLDGSYYLSSITLSKICQRYSYLLRLNKQVAVHPALIVDWHVPARKQLVVVLAGWGNSQAVSVARRRISQVKDVLDQS